MNLEDVIKYLLWIVFFGIALAGIYKILSSLGVIG